MNPIGVILTESRIERRLKQGGQALVPEDDEFTLDFGDLGSNVDLLRNHGLLAFTLTMALTE
jgi:hypothetical protein